MRISDWSSDVCSSDLRQMLGRPPASEPGVVRGVEEKVGAVARVDHPAGKDDFKADLDTGRSRSEERRVGKECVRRVDLGGCSNIKNNILHNNIHNTIKLTSPYLNTHNS